MKTRFVDGLFFFQSNPFLKRELLLLARGVPDVECNAFPGFWLGVLVKQSTTVDAAAHQGPETCLLGPSAGALALIPGSHAFHPIFPQGRCLVPILACLAVLPTPLSALIIPPGVKARCLLPAFPSPWRVNVMGVYTFL